MSLPREIAGKYRVGELLGRGGRGEVYRALQIDLDRQVALKLLTGASAEERARFVREARLAADLRHPGIAQVFDAGVAADGTPYIAMELFEGETVAQRIARDGPLTAAEAVPIAIAVCRALEAVHQKGFLHRDVKPSNVLLARGATGAAEPKLIDFGVAKRLVTKDGPRRRATTERGLGTIMTAADIIVGTPWYLSPEQVVGDPLDARSDVYAVGVTLYEMLTGAPPFTGSIHVVLDQIVRGTVASLKRKALDPRIPTALRVEVFRALAKRPEDRHPSARELADALEQAMTQADTGAIPLDPSRRRRRARAMVGALAALFALVSLVGLITRSFSRRAARLEPPPPSASAALATPPPDPQVAAPAEPSTLAVPAATQSARAQRRAPPAPRSTRTVETVVPSPSQTATRGYRVDDLKGAY